MKNPGLIIQLEDGSFARTIHKNSAPAGSGKVIIYRCILMDIKTKLPVGYSDKGTLVLAHKVDKVIGFID